MENNVKKQYLSEKDIYEMLKKIIFKPYDQPEALQIMEEFIKKYDKDYDG